MGRKARDGRPANCTPQELGKFICLLVQEEASSEGCSSGTGASVPSRGTRTAAGCSTPGSGTASCLGFRSSGTCGNSTGGRGGESPVSSAPASPASPIAPPASILGKRTRGTFGRIRCVAYARWDPASCSWRTCRGFWDMPILAQSSGGWPRAGTLRNGMLYRRRPWVLPTYAKGCGYLPTPTAPDAKGRSGKGHVHRHGAKKLADVLPTPNSSNGLRGGKQDGHYPWKWGVPGDPGYSALNPDFVEWMMGWPIGWTASSPLATARFHRWLRLSSACSLRGRGCPYDGPT